MPPVSDNVLSLTGGIFLSYPQIRVLGRVAILDLLIVETSPQTATFHTLREGGSAHFSHRSRSPHMSHINVSYADIEQAAAQLGHGREEIGERLQRLQAVIQQLVSSGFVTEHASVKLDGAYSEYTTSANSVIAKLSEIQTFLLQTAGSMRELDAQIAARIN